MSAYIQFRNSLTTQSPPLSSFILDKCFGDDSSPLAKSLWTVATVATAKYGTLSEVLRQSITEARLCSMFCGGKNCKYEGPASWSEDQQAISGLYSHWYVKLLVFFQLLLLLLLCNWGLSDFEKLHCVPKYCWKWLFWISQGNVATSDR